MGLDAVTASRGPRHTAGILAQLRSLIGKAGGEFMPVEVQDVLKINIVFVGIGVLNDPGKVAAFSDAVGAEVLRAGEEIGLVGGISPAAAAVGQRLALQRDRISIGSSPDRTAIEREFPLESDLQRLADVADEALRSREGEEFPRAVGYNLEMVYDQDSGFPAFQYIGKRLFREDTFAPEGWELAGGAGRLVFGSAAGRWTVQIEPRLGDASSSRVYLNLNFHIEGQKLPDRAEMLRTFQHVWSQSHDFAQRLDEGGAS